MRKEFADSQVLMTGENSHELIHLGNGSDPSNTRNPIENSNSGGLDLNPFQERDQMQTAIVLQTGTDSD